VTHASEAISRDEAINNYLIIKKTYTDGQNVRDAERAAFLLSPAYQEEQRSSKEWRDLQDEKARLATITDLNRLRREVADARGTKEVVVRSLRRLAVCLDNNNVEYCMKHENDTATK
jgi:hypothetical protein